MKIVAGILSYFIGALPFGYLLFRLSEKRDIRRFGSRSTGATNVLRLKGWRYAIPVALLDIGKGFIPAFVVFKIYGEPKLSAVCASLAVIGHCFPVYIGFKGGKGVATAAGAMFAIALSPALLSFVVFIATVVLTKYVSLGSILAVVLFPLFLILFGIPLSVLLLSLPILVIILIRHAGNIGRLIRGTEPKFGQKAGIAT